MSGAHEAHDFYCGVGFTVADVQRHRPDLSEDAARAFLLRHETTIQAAMEGTGDAVIQYLIDRDHECNVSG
jgi:hypothetical protein